jgi:hypothetical protein
MCKLHYVEGCYHTRLPTGLLSTQAKMEGITLKAAWHWGTSSCVVNDPLGERGRAPLYKSFLLSGVPWW